MIFYTRLLLLFLVPSLLACCATKPEPWNYVHAGKKPAHLSIVFTERDYSLTFDAKVHLHEISDYLKLYPAAKITIKATPREISQTKLAQQLASRVRNYLLEKAVTAQQINMTLNLQVNPSLEAPQVDIWVHDPRQE